ncbi:MTH1187 family thiamine-binding protein [Paenibacillus sp. ACRRX]|uniref:MTH1187 family thiamine-binding protein n=1 Tax=unclassified Paenibacillus TaxID=185978 RepID=UPI001EF5D6D4|nr:MULTISPECIES: MTH1187 family thiamine-binding protein [unclassified Paenibacillus]MCG7408695.1 MTH1187 family thiamine-binding protein [Paenibacillus sp. ACRRX]MDK8183462.1 MTH1187 family thiamine-binding protein [Paenibacillus sp. UMB4589-SE434]
MAIAEVTIIPIGTATTSLSGYVAGMQQVLAQEEGITYELTSMSTIIEGPTDRLFEVIRTLHESLFETGAGRVSTSIKIDDRRDQPSSSVQKLRSVREKLQS